MFDSYSELVHDVADEVKSFIRSNIGRRATEEQIREYFEDGVLDEWVDDGVCSMREAKDALELAIYEINMARSERVK